MRTTAKALWDALAQPEFTRPYYTGMEIKTDSKPGGRFDDDHRFEYHQRHGTGLEGELFEVVPQKKLVHTFHPKFIAPGPSRVSYEIEPMGTACKLTVTHDPFPDDFIYFVIFGTLVWLTRNGFLASILAGLLVPDHKTKEAYYAQS